MSVLIRDCVGTQGAFQEEKHIGYAEHMSDAIFKEDPGNPCYGACMSSWLIRQFSRDLTYIAGAYMDVKNLVEFTPKPCVGSQGLGLGLRMGFEKLSWDLEFGWCLWRWGVRV